MRRNQTLCYWEVHRFLNGPFDGGPMPSASHRWPTPPSTSSRPLRLPVNTTGQGLALARGLLTKHAIKQVDRLLSNHGIDIDAAPRHLVPYVVGPRGGIRVARDWIDMAARRFRAIATSAI
jgi:hypothetical protein